MSTHDPAMYWIRYNTKHKWWILVSCSYGHPIDQFYTKPGSGFAGSAAEVKVGRVDFHCRDCEALGREKKPEEHGIPPTEEIRGPHRGPGLLDSLLAHLQSVTKLSAAVRRSPPFAMAHVRKMRGGSQAHLLRASDGNLYVTKFQNTPHGIRTLASEFLATKLGLFLGLPMTEIQVIEVSDSLIAVSPALGIEIDGVISPCATGLQLGSRYAGDPMKGDLIFDHMPESQFHRVINRMDIVRMLAFDKWVGNCDGRQAVFVKPADASGYHMIFIDQHYCFDGQWWSFPDLPSHGAYPHAFVYEQVTGWESFEPTLSRIEAIEYEDLWRCAAQIPHEWIEYDGEGLFSLIEVLHRRRSVVRDLILGFCALQCATHRLKHHVSGMNQQTGNGVTC